MSRILQCVYYVYIKRETGSVLIEVNSVFFNRKQKNPQQKTKKQKKKKIIFLKTILDNDQRKPPFVT